MKLQMLQLIHTKNGYLHQHIYLYLYHYIEKGYVDSTQQSVSQHMFL